MEKLVLSGRIENGCHFKVFSQPQISTIKVQLLSNFTPDEVVDAAELRWDELGEWLENRLDY